MNFLQKLTELARFKLWAPFRADQFSSYNLSHSQFGEDMVIRSIFDGKRYGAYVDIGAHHPVYYSNTYHFYRRGWRGLNVDAAPGTKELFDLLRPGDVNVQACISARTGQQMKFYVMDPPARSTIDRASAEQVARLGQGTIVQEIEIESLAIDDCLARHFRWEHIDLMSIDVEGMDELILRSCDWARWKPEVVVFEDHAADLADVATQTSIQFMRSCNYKLFGKCGPSVILRRVS